MVEAKHVRVLKHFEGNSYISVDQITHPDQIAALFASAHEMGSHIDNSKRQVYEPLRGFYATILFYQASTRTYTSFDAATKRLGMYVTGIQGMDQYSSAVKGEDLEDTIRSVEMTEGSDLIILRHPDNDSSQVAAEIASVPVINAGSGTKEHPTQALLDLLTIKETQGKMSGLNIAMVGDLKYGRTIKSLSKLLALVNGGTKLYFISPEELRAPKELVSALREKCEVIESDDLQGLLPELDALYMTRVQREWFEKEGKMDEYARIKDKFILTAELAQQMKKTATIMHPLPRLNEIEKLVDKDERAKYYQQMRYGLQLRMALIQAILLGR